MAFPKDVDWIKSPNNYISNTLLGKWFVCQVVASQKNKHNQLAGPLLQVLWYSAVCLGLCVCLHLFYLLLELVMLYTKSPINKPPPHLKFMALITRIVPSLPHYMFWLFYYHFILQEWKRLVQHHFWYVRLSYGWLAEDMGYLLCTSEWSFQSGLT